MPDAIPSSTPCVPKHSSLAAAEAAITTEAFNKNPQLNAVPLRSWIIAKGDTTTLQDDTKAKIIEAGKFGDSSVGGASSSTTTMQGAYDNSAEPEILTTVLNGAVSYKRGTALDADDVFEVEDGATKGAIAKAFKKHANSKKTNKLFATQFAKMVA